MNPIEEKYDCTYGFGVLSTVNDTRPFINAEMITIDGVLSSINGVPNGFNREIIATSGILNSIHV
jgi:hypothetical protein